MLKQCLHILFIGVCLNLCAQESITFNTSDGLPTNHIYDIVQDSKGFMWFATNQGVVKFDGDTFRTFNLKDGLPNNDTWLLHADQEDRVWYFSKSKKQGFIKNDSVFSFPNRENLIKTPTIYLLQNDKVIYWSNYGLMTLKDSVFETILSRKDYELKQKILKRNFTDNNPNVFPILSDSLIFGQSKKHYFLVNKHSLSVKKITNQFDSELPLQGKHLPNNNVFIIYPKGFTIIDLKTFTQKVYSFSDLLDVELVENVRLKYLSYEIQLSGDGYILKFDHEFNLKTKQKLPQSEPSQINYEDTEGNIWTSSTKNGISFIPKAQRETKVYLKNKKVQKLGLFDQSIVAGVAYEGFYKLDPEEDQFVSELVSPNETYIYHIKIDELKRSYLISDYYTLVQKNTLDSNRTNNISTYSTSNTLIDDPYLRYAKVLSDVNVGLTNKFQTYLRQGIYYSIKDILYLERDTYFCSPNFVGYVNHLDDFKKIYEFGGINNLIKVNKKIIAGGANGLYIFKKDSIVDVPNKTSLLSTPVLSLTKDKDKVLVGTDGRGVYLYKNEIAIHLEESDGLSVKRILKEQDTLWLSTQNGVKKFQLNTDAIQNSKIIDSYYKSDGLLQNNTNDIFKKDSLLYVATDIGISRLNLNNPLYKRPPKLYFKHKKDTILFDNTDQANLNISFGVQQYTSQRHLQFQYRLLPLQTDWNNTESKTLNFSSLTPDIYTLEIKAEDQHFNKTVKQISIVVIPKLWETAIFKIGVLVAFVIFCYIIYRFTKTQIQQREQAKAEREKRVSKLELQALRSQMNPHFVHNTLNAIQYFIHRHEVELSEDYLSKFSKLIRMFFEYSRRQTITLKEELNLLTKYLEIEKLRFEEKLQFNISVAKKIDIEETLIPSMILQPIAENAVNHGLFHKREKGTINLNFEHEKDDTIKVVIEDDGIGITAAKNIYEKSSKNYKSNSTQVLKERLELLNKSQEWKIKYQIIDRSELGQGLTGTVVTLTITKKVVL